MLLEVAGYPMPMISLLLGQGVTWLDSFSSVPIKKIVTEKIGVATPMGKGKEKKIKKETSKKSKVEESAEVTESDQGTKRRKTASARK